MKNNTIYETPAVPTAEPRSHVDLRGQALQLAGNYLRKTELAPTLRRNQQLQKSLLTEYAGNSPKDQALLRKCLQDVDLLGMRFIIPRRKVMLSVHEVMRLLELGFRFGKVDPKFEIRSQGEKRKPYYHGEPIPAQDWERKFACVLKHKLCLELLKEYRNALEVVEHHVHVAMSNKSHNSSLNNMLRQQTEEMMFQFRVPTKFDLQDPPLIPAEESLFTKNRQVMECMLTEAAREALEKQKQEQLPSLFNKETLPAVQAVPHHVLILLDISASTFEKEIFKVANLACAALLRTLHHYLPEATISVLPYSDSALGPLTEIQSFIAPGGTTAYDEVFVAAQKLLGPADGHRAVIHISDGLPNSIEDAQEQALQFPALNIRYGQIIFGHTKRVSDLVDYIFVDEATPLGQSREETRYEKYVAHFTSVAHASDGEQIILWVMQHLDEAMMAMMDLFIGQYFLQHTTPTPETNVATSLPC